jgi:anaerobic magnesium-protoporphyrin IX monomethyl ester cyclase
VVVGLAKIKRADLKDASVMDKITNISYRGGDGVPRVNDMGYIPDLDSMPMPAWDLIDPRSYPEAPHGTFARSFPIAPIITSRGCPYKCSFCARFRIHGRKIRRRSPSAVLDEIELLSGRYGVKELHIEDDNFTMGKEYAKDVLSGIIDRGIKISIALPNGVRIDALDTELLGLMERAGVYSLGIGIESGSDRILRRMQKGLNTRTISNGVDFIKTHSRIRITGFFLIGHPEETERDILRSMVFANRLKLDTVSFSPLMPLPGSEIYDEWKKRVDFDNVDWSKFLHYQFIPHMSSIDIKKLEKLLRGANLSFYLRPHIFMGLLKEVRTPYQMKMLLKRANKILRG